MTAPRGTGHPPRPAAPGAADVPPDAEAARVATAVTAAERRRLARRLHDGVVQQVTALSLAVDSALLRHAGGDAADVDDALRVIRALADRAVRDCRALMDDLNRPVDP